MTERKTKICLISPTENLAKRARALITRQGMNIRVEDCRSGVSRFAGKEAVGTG